MRKSLMAFAALAAIAWPSAASAFVDESNVEITRKSEELKSSTLSLTPSKEKTHIEHDKPEKERHTTKKHSNSKRVTRSEHRESEAQRREQVRRTIDMINIGISVGTSLGHGGGGGGRGKYHNEHHKD